MLVVGVYLLLASALGLPLGFASALGLPLGFAWALAPLLTLCLLTLNSRTSTSSALTALTVLYGVVYLRTGNHSLRGLEPAFAIAAQLVLASLLMLVAHIRRGMRQSARRH
jgi:hypothetical protein